MFDVFGAVSDAANGYLSVVAESLFPIGFGVVFDAEVESGAYSGDRVTVGATTVELERIYSITHLTDGDIDLRPDEFALRMIVPAVRAVAEGFRDKVQNAEVVAVRAPRLLAPSVAVHGGGSLDVNGVPLRWLLDYDARYLGDRLLVDVLAGTADEMALPR